MKIIDRYIAAAIAAGTGIALLVIVGLDVFFKIIDQLDNVGVGTYTLGKMLQYVALTTPQTLYELFPMAALLGSLIGMGMLAANSELIAMRASGISVWRILRSVLQAGLLMLVLVMLIGELVAPPAEHYGQKLRAAATNKGASFLGTLGLWVRDGEYYINVRKIIRDDNLAGVTIYEFNPDASLAMITRSARAQFIEDAWQMFEVEQTVFEEGGVSLTHHDRVTRDKLVTPELLSVVVLKPRAMSVVAISQLVDYLDENGLDAQSYRYAFWGRLMTPVASLVMLLVSVPFVFGGLRSVSTGQRVFVGIMVGFGFYVVSQISSQMGQVYALNPLIASLAPSLVFTVFGVLAIRNIQIRD